MNFEKKQKQVKLFLWFFFALMADLIVMHNFTILYAKPVLSYILLISAMLLEKDFSYAMKVALAMSIVLASLLGGSFGLEIVFLMAASVVIFSSGRKNRYIPEVAIAFITSASFTAAHIAYMIIYANGLEALEAMGNMIVANVVYNAAIAVIIFIPFRKSVYKDSIEKKLIS